MNKTYYRMFLIALPFWALTHIAAKADDQTNGPQVSLTVGGEVASVSGDKAKFRQDSWIKDGPAGGVEEATWHQQLDKDTTLDLNTRIFVGEHDYKMQLELARKDVGFIRAGYVEYVKYFDNAGGFYRPFNPPEFSLQGNKNLDICNYFFEAGLTLPNLPKIVFGWERKTKNGTESLLEWGDVTQGGITRRIYPSTKFIDETTDILKASIDYDFKKVHVGDEFRFEYYKSDTNRRDTSVNLDTSTAKTVTITEDYRHNDFFNTFHMDCHVNEKFYWSLGYLYSWLDGSAGIQVETPGPITPNDRNWLANAIDLNQDSHVLNVNALFGPFAGLSIYAGAQGERTETTGFTDALLQTGLSPVGTNLIHSTNNKDSLSGTLGLRFTKIPFTTLYAEGKWTEQDIDVRENQFGDPANTFFRMADESTFRQDYRVGFNTAPIRRLTLAGSYRHYIANNDYDNATDTAVGYPGFITAQDFTTDEVTGKLTLRPCSRFSMALQYKLVATDIQTANEAIAPIVPRGSHQSGDYNASIYSVTATVTPLSRLYLTGLFSFQDTRTSAFDNGSPAVITYRGNVYSVIGTAGYALDNKTDLTLEYSYSMSDNFHNNDANGLPLGLDYHRHALLAGISRKLRENVIGRFRFGYDEYRESSSAGLNNYRALIFAANCTVRF